MKLILVMSVSFLMFGCTSPVGSRTPASQAEDYGKVKVPRQVVKSNFGKSFFDDFDKADDGKEVAKIIASLARSQAQNAAPEPGTESFGDFVKRNAADEAKIFLAPKKYGKMKGKVDDGNSELYKTIKLLSWMRGNPLELFKQLRENPDLPGTRDEFKDHMVTGPLPGVDKYYKPGAHGKADTLPTTGKPAEFSGRTVFIVHNEDVREALNTAKMEPENPNNNDNVFSVALYNPKMDRVVGSEFMLSKEFGFTRQEKMAMRKIMPPTDMEWIRKRATELAQKSIRHSNVNGRIDIVNAIARRVPVEMTRDYFGYKADLRSIYRWSRATQKSFFHNPTNNPGHERRAKQAGIELREHVRGMIKEHLKTGNYLAENTIAYRVMNMEIPASFSAKVNNLEYDKISNRNNRACVGANNDYIGADGNKVSKEQCIWYERVVANIIGTLVGGIETTQAAITNVVDFFLDNPDIKRGAVAAAKSGDHRRLSAFVWEALRFRPINPIVMRYVQKDYTFDGSKRKVKKGDIAMISTLSAMFDDSGDKPAVVKPDHFIVGRGSVNARGSHKKHGHTRDNAYYFHLGNGDHKCLGDYVAAALVPAVVGEILKLPNLARLDHEESPGAKKVHGYIDFHDNIGALEKDEDQDVSSAFPETMVLQTSKSRSNNADIHGVTIADPRFMFEDYLMDYDKNDFRACLSDFDEFSQTEEIDLKGKDYIAVEGYHNRMASSAASDLFYCRLPTKFRNCIQKDSSGRKKIFQIGENYLTKYEGCKSELTPRENYFYKTEILNTLPKPWYDKYISPQWYVRNNVNKYGRTPLEFNKVPKSHNVAYRGPTHTHEPWEEDIKFYDRANYRQTYMNPFTAIAYKTTDSTGGNKLNFYTRVDLEFRKCNSKKATDFSKEDVAKAKKGFMGIGKKKLAPRKIEEVKVQAWLRAYKHCIKERHALPDYIYNHYKKTYMGM